MTIMKEKDYSVIVIIGLLIAVILSSIVNGCDYILYNYTQGE